MTLFGNKSKRLKDMEMILRFFAFYYYSSVQEFDSKRVAICTREVAEPAVWSEAGSSEVARWRSAVAAR
jgi:hypothetical protein